MIVKFKEHAEEVSMEELCKWAQVPKSSFYYKAHPGTRGMKASTHTPIGDGLVENELVVEQIRAVLGMDYCVYGYQMMTTELRTMEYLINKKKVYRLMRENRLLCGKVIKTQGKRKWVEFRRIEAKHPMEYLCLDITYVWVHGENRWYYQLAIMDVFSRRILCYIFQRSVKQTDVIALLRWLDLRFGLKGVIIRNDNGSQFIANKVRQTLQDLEAKQEFTHVATPEENAYIEAFHSIQQRELMNRFAFSSFYDAKQHIEKYMRWYNCKRRHGSLGGITPMQKWAQGSFRALVRQHYEPASVDLSRPGSVCPWDASALYSLDKSSETAYLRLTSERDEQQLVANLIEKNVQLIGG
jgi:transposase InsO family protein